MLRKTTAAVVLAGALALGTASATSLGDFDNINFAASDVTLETCALTVTSGLIDLIPDLPSAGDAVGSATVPTGGTVLLDQLDLTDLVSNLTDCTGEMADLVVIGDHDLDVATADQVLGGAEDIDLTTPGSYNSVSLVDPADGSAVSIDIERVTELRLVVSNA